MATDLTDAAGCAMLQAKAVQLGVIGGLPHCVGSTIVRPLHLTSEKDWQEQFAVNATSAFHLLKWFVLHATKAQTPAIAVLTSSVVAEAGFANHEGKGWSRLTTPGPLLTDRTDPCGK